AGGGIELVAATDLTVGAEGSVTANGVSGGTVSLFAGGIAALSGAIGAKGAAGPGGRVEILGDYTGLFDGARVNASGATGGGTILIGGDYQGGSVLRDGVVLPNSRRTFVGSDTELRADALNTGNGGKVV